MRFEACIKLFFTKILFINKKIKKLAFLAYSLYPIDPTTLFGASSGVYLGP